MATITEDYVSFEVAKLLKEKGFNEQTRDFYHFENNIWIHRNTYEHNYFNLGVSRWKDCYSCPTLQMTCKWLRKVHNIDIIALPQYDGIKWTYSVIIFKLSIPCTQIRLNDNKDKKEEAVEVAIKYCLENLI